MWQSRRGSKNSAWKGAYDALTKADQAKKQGPREGRKQVQEYLCLCYLVSGSKCLCGKKCGFMQDPHGRPGERISSCQVVQCDCSCCPFKDNQRQDIAMSYLEQKENGKDSGPRTVSDNIGSFVNELITNSIHVIASALFSSLCHESYILFDCCMFSIF